MLPNNTLLDKVHNFAASNRMQFVPFMGCFLFRLQTFRDVYANLAGVAASSVRLTDGEECVCGGFQCNANAGVTTANDGSTLMMMLVLALLSLVIVI